MSAQSPAASLATWERYRRALAGQPLPAAVVDLDALERNIDRLVGQARAGGKTLRVASKSVRCPELLRRIQRRGGDTVAGLMTYSAAETAWLFEQGFDDLLLAYPTVLASDLALLCGAVNAGARLALVADSEAHLDALQAAAAQHDARLCVVLELDLAYRPLGAGLHIGVRRSPLRDASQVVALARQCDQRAGLAFGGVMAYEAHIAGLTDRSPFSAWMNGPKRMIKRLSRGHVERARAEVRRALAEAGLEPALFNGGGSGSLGWCAAEPALTEVTAGSGFIGSHLFDYYHDLQVDPALYFALQVVRLPAEGMVTCHGGGYIASGEAGPDRAPLPALPPGLRLLQLEGAGEVQTPLTVPPGIELAPGDPVLLRHAKAGELAEHFNEYLLVRGDAVEASGHTYRGLGRCFLG